MKYCPKCGKENKDANRFCLYCGSQLRDREEDPIGANVPQQGSANVPQQGSANVPPQQGSANVPPKQPAGANVPPQRPAGSVPERKKSAVFPIVVVLLVLMIAALAAAAAYLIKQRQAAASAPDGQEAAFDSDEKEASPKVEKGDRESISSDSKDGKADDEDGEEGPADDAADGIDLSGIDLDGVNQKNVAATGMVIQDGGQFFIQLFSPVSIAGKNSKNEIKTVSDVELLCIKGQSFGTYEGEVLKVRGTIGFSDAGEAYMDVSKLKKESYGSVTDHTYEIVVQDVSWDEAFRQAQNKGGYLVNFDSRAELEYVLSLIAKNGDENKIFFLGAGRKTDDYNYYWVDADSYFRTSQCINPQECDWLSSYWMDGEPSYGSDDGDGYYVDEYYVDMFMRQGKWVLNDVPDDILSIVPTYSGKVGYIIEYEK